MKYSFSIMSVLMLLLISSLLAGQKFDDLDAYKWENRLIVLFVQDIESQELLRQLDNIQAHEPGYSERDIKVLIVNQEEVVDRRLHPITNLQADALRKRFGMEKKDFQYMLIGKDGTEKYRSDQVVSHQTIFGIIDQMPMRRREMRENR